MTILHLQQGKIWNIISFADEKKIKNALKKKFRNVLTMMKCSAYHEHLPKAIFETGSLHFTYSRKKDLFAYKKRAQYHCF